MKILSHRQQRTVLSAVKACWLLGFLLIGAADHIAAAAATCVLWSVAVILYRWADGSHAITDPFDGELL